MERYRNAGKKFDPDLKIKEIAKRLRKEIRAMQSKGLFADAKISVRLSRYSMGQSLTVSIVEWPGEIYTPEFVAVNERNGDTADVQRMHPRASKILSVLKEMGNQWNYDNSDSMTDYYETNYGLTVTFDAELSNRDYDSKTRRGRSRWRAA